MNEHTANFILYSIFFSSTLILSGCFSYKFQKDFTSQTKPLKVFIILLTAIIALIVSIFAVVIIDVFNFNLKIGPIQESLTGPTTNVLSFPYSNSDLKTIDNSTTNNDYKLNPTNKTILLILLTINAFCYLIIPFLLFYYIEEKNINQSMNQPINNDDIIVEEEEEALDLVESSFPNTNSPNFETSPFNMSLFKNYFYYLQALCLTNLMYLVFFKINYFDSAKNLLRYSIVPDGLRKYSHLNSDLEILTYINFLVLVSIGKLFFLIYVPYGAGKLTASLINNLKGGETMKKEYHHLNSNFSRNYETIKNLTSQKLMTGRPLTKKEKIILKNCKETETILQHKQEVLEDKFSKWRMCLFYAIMPFKFIFIFVSVIFILLFVISKGLLLYSQIEQSVCGIDCGYIVNTHKMGLSIQTLLEHVNKKYLEFIIVSSFLIYLISNQLKGMKNLGIINLLPNRSSFPTSEVRSDKVLAVIYYSIFFLLSLVSILEMFSVSPYFSSFHHVNNNHSGQNHCDVYDLDSVKCNISYFGIFYLKFNVNFSLFRYWDLFFSSCLIFLMICSVLYYPIKSVISFKKGEENNEEEESYEKHPDV